MTRFFASASIALLFLTLTATSCSDDDSSSSASSSSAPASIKLTIASYNVEDFSYSGAYATIANYVKTAQIDVIFLCETQLPGQDSDTTGDEAPFAAALTAAGWSMPYHQFIEADNYNAIGIFSRYPISDVAPVVDGTFVDPVGKTSIASVRPMMQTKVTLPTGRAVWFYGAHLRAMSSGLAERRAQAHAFEEFIKTKPGVNVLTDYIVVCGDLNTTQGPSANPSDFSTTGTLGYLSLKYDDATDTANNFTPVNYTFLPTAYSYPSYPSLLDHIILSPAAYANYVSGSVSVSDYNGSTANPSDHLPVTCQILY